MLDNDAWAPSAANTRSEIAAPGVFDPTAPMPTVWRAFGFVDMCRFTAFSDRAGVEATSAELRRFRLLSRAVTSHRGVRIAKWLGDGAMIVGVDGPSLVAAVVEIVGRYQPLPIDLRGGVAAGEALMIDGDDYAGRAVNLAARLCDSARPNTTLIAADELTYDIAWIHTSAERARRVRGLGKVERVVSATVDANVDLGPPPQ